MKQLSWMVTLLALAQIFAPDAGKAQALRGVQVGPSAPEPEPFRLAGGSTAGLINFDDDVEPCLFFFTVALTDEYSGLGVVFAGPGGFDGGAILDECSGFGVTGHSPPNFLAFNSESDLADGGIPGGPETLTFDPPVDVVRINAGNVEPDQITMECFDGLGAPLGSSSITAATALQALAVTAAGIESCVLSFTGISAVFDDLAYEMLLFGDDFESGDLSMWSSSAP